MAAVGETGQPVRGIAEHRRLVVAGNRQPRLLEQEAGAFQQPAAVELRGELMLDIGQFHLEGFRAPIVRGGVDLGGNASAAVAGQAVRRPQPLRGLAGLGQPPFERRHAGGLLAGGLRLSDGRWSALGRHERPPGIGAAGEFGDHRVVRLVMLVMQPLVDVDRCSDPSAAVEPCGLGLLRLLLGPLEERTTIDLGQEIGFVGHGPAGEEVLHMVLGHGELLLAAAVGRAGPLELAGERSATAVRERLGRKRLAELADMLQRRRLRDEIAFHHQFVDSLGERCEFLTLVPGLLGEPPAVVVEREKRVPVEADLLHFTRRERGRQAAVLQGLLPPQAGGLAERHRPLERLLRHGDLVGEHVHGAFAGGQLLEPFDLRLCHRCPAFERVDGVGGDLLVEQAALSEQIVPLLVHHRALAAGRFEAVRGGAVERPGGHRRQPRAGKAERGQGVGQWTGDRLRQQEPREQHARAGDENRAERDQPAQGDELSLHEMDDFAVDAGDRLVEVCQLGGGGEAVAEEGGPAARLFDGLGDRHALGPDASLDQSAGVVEQALGFGHTTFGRFHLARGLGTIPGTGPQRTKRLEEALGQEHVGERVGGIERPGDRDDAREAGRADLFAEASCGEPRVRFGAGHLRHDPLQAGLFLAECGHRGPPLPDRRLCGHLGQAAGQSATGPLATADEPRQLVAALRRPLPGVEIGMDERRAHHRIELRGGVTIGLIERFDPEHAADDVFLSHGPFDRGCERCQFGVGAGQFGQQTASRHGRRVQGSEPIEHLVPTQPQRLHRRDGSIIRVEPLDRLADVPEHAGHLRAVEAAGEFVKPAAAALRVERAKLVQFVEAEGHHVGECPLVDVADDVLEIGAVPRAAIHRRHDVFDRDEVAMVAAEADDVVLVAGPRERRQFRALMPALDRQPAALWARVHDQLAGTGQLRVEHAAAKQPLKAEEHRP